MAGVSILCLCNDYEEIQAVTFPSDSLLICKEKTKIPLIFGIV